jgi:hypothetical protein
MQRDDLFKRLRLHPVHNCWDSEPVTDAEVLEALGAKRVWWCVADGWPCDAWSTGYEGHLTCRFVWIVEEDR